MDQEADPVFEPKIVEQRDEFARRDRSLDGFEPMRVLRSASPSEKPPEMLEHFAQRALEIRRLGNEEAATWPQHAFKLANARLRFGQMVQQALARNAVERFVPRTHASHVSLYELHGAWDVCAGEVLPANCQHLRRVVDTEHREPASRKCQAEHPCPAAKIERPTVLFSSSDFIEVRLNDVAVIHTEHRGRVLIVCRRCSAMELDVSS